jgi:hypothetical protein
MNTTTDTTTIISNDTSIEILLDETVKDNDFFQKLKSVNINKTELFKYAIMMWEVPPKVRESDFDYLQNLVPALEKLLSDFIGFSKNSISNLSDDDRVKKMVSEAVGVGLGLKYSTILLNTNPNKFKKIGVPSEGKYLDYSTIAEKKIYEIETKGTVNNYYTSIKKDILEKKADSLARPVHLRFGTIMLIKNSHDKTKSKFVVVDDPPNEVERSNDDTFETQLWNYAMLLSYILDSKYYNKFVIPLRQNRLGRVRVNSNKFFGRYHFKGKEYYGECFDYRLIKDLFQQFAAQVEFIKNLFKLLTEKLGKTKFFIGLEESVLTAINKKDQEYLNSFHANRILVNERNIIQFLDNDGILIVKSTKGVDKQLERIFPEEEVEKRINLYRNYIEGNAHQCKAPCTSRGIEGKPCEKMTFRDHCYFHR